MRRSSLLAAVAARKEAERGASPPPEPRLFVGTERRLRPPTLRFSRPPA